MNFFAVTGYVVFCTTLINNWLEKFVRHNLSTTGYLWNKIFSVTRTVQFDATASYTAYSNGVIFFVTAFGLNAIIHSIQYRVLPVTLVMYTLNVLCFVLHCGYSSLLPFHIVQDYPAGGLQLIYNFIMWMYLNYVYFFEPSYEMYLKYFIVVTIPYLFRAYYGLLDYHYNGHNMLVKTLDIYLNYF
jgi:hypothetical protein